MHAGGQPAQLGDGTAAVVEAVEIDDLDPLNAGAGGVVLVAESRFGLVVDLHGGVAGRGAGRLAAGPECEVGEDEVGPCGPVEG